MVDKRLLVHVSQTFFKEEKTASKRQEAGTPGYPQKRAFICLQNDLYTILSTLSTEKQAHQKEGFWNGCFVDNVQREEKDRKVSNKGDK